MVLSLNRRHLRRGLRRKRPRKKMTMIVMMQRLKTNHRRRHLGSVKRLLLNQNRLKQRLLQRKEAKQQKLKKRRNPKNLPKRLRKSRRKTQRNRRNKRKPKPRRMVKQKLLRKQRNQKMKSLRQAARKILNLPPSLLQSLKKENQMRVKRVPSSQ